MTRLRIATLLAVVVLLMPSLLVQAGSPARTTGLWPGASAGFPLDAQALSLSSIPCVTEVLDGQIIQYCIPLDFNGQLLVYAHGYAAPHLGLSLPVELSVPPWQGLVEGFVSSGFGFATTSYSKNGYAIEQAESDLLALVEHVKGQQPPGAVTQVLLLGVSEGGLITTMMVEKHPDVFAGGLAACGPVGGMPYQVDYMGDFRVVFDNLFPSVLKPSFGAVDVPQDAYLHWDTYASGIAAALARNPKKTEQLYNIRLANDTVVARDPADLEGSSVQAAQDLLRYNIWGTYDLIATAGGQPYGNAERWYWGSSNDWPFNVRVERETADSAARAYVQQYYEPSGSLQVPLVTLHTTADWVVPYQHEAIYLARATAAGAADYLTPVPVDRCGHCNFTEGDVVYALQLLLSGTAAQ